jgi:hypothetical protein
MKLAAQCETQAKQFVREGFMVPLPNCYSIRGTAPELMALVGARKSWRHDTYIMHEFVIKQKELQCSSHEIGSLPNWR